jgi:hypothetical protein
METQGAARIGNGSKLHPATRTQGGYVEFLCSCGGTQNGHASNRATFFVGLASTCGVRQTSDEWTPVADADAWKAADDALIAKRRGFYIEA